MSDKPHEMAVRSPWTEGAWLMLLAHVPPGWKVRRHPQDEWRWDCECALVEARPSGGES